MPPPPPKPAGGAWPQTRRRDNAKLATLVALKEPKEPIEPVSSPLKSKISITDIVEEAATPNVHISEGEAMVEAFKKSTSTGSKRKA